MSQVGHLNNNAKITSDQARSICKLLESTSLTLGQIALKLKISRHIVVNIYQRKSWTSISIPYIFTNRRPVYLDKK